MTSSSLHAKQVGPRRRRWSSVAILFALIVVVEIALLYLLTWVDTPQQVLFVPIHVADYQARPIAARVRAASWPPSSTEAMPGGASRQAILDEVDALARHGSKQAMVIHVSALAVQAEDGDVYLLPGDATPDDTWTWLKLRDLLVKLKACPTRQKLLVLDLQPATSARLGCVYSDLGAAMPHELDRVPDADRRVLCSHTAGQQSHLLPDGAGSVFSYYLTQALRGQGDSDSAADGAVSVTEAAAFVRKRVERWSLLNRGERQTPTLHGTGPDFAVAPVDATAGGAPPALPRRDYPAWLIDAWKARDASHEGGQHRLAPRLFQQQQALLLGLEQGWRSGVSELLLKKHWLPEVERVQQALLRVARGTTSDLADRPTLDAGPRKTFDEWWRRLQQQLGGASPGDGERIKSRAIDELRSKLDGVNLDAIVADHALAEARLDPASLRLYDRLLHPTAQSAPRTAASLRIRQLADLAMRVEPSAWPADVIEALLRTNERAETATSVLSAVPGYASLLDEPAQHQHAGEVRVWAHGYANLDDAKQRLLRASSQFERLHQLHEQWQRDTLLLYDALAELPGYLPALETTPAWRSSWERAMTATRKLAEALQPIAEDAKKEKPSWDERVSQLAVQARSATEQGREVRHHLQLLREPFTQDATDRLDRQCRSGSADAAALRTIDALLNSSVLVLRAEARVQLNQAASTLGRRLHEETAALDRLDQDARKSTSVVEAKVASDDGPVRRAEWRARAQLAMLTLAGMPEAKLRPLHVELEVCTSKASDLDAWRELGLGLQRMLIEHVPQRHRQESSWQGRERLAWVAPPFDRHAKMDDAETSLTVQALREAKQRQERWRLDQRRFLAAAYHHLNLESAGIIAARSFYGGAKTDADPRLRLKLLEAIAPLSKETPYAHFWLEVTRQVPGGQFGPVELHAHRADDQWLELAPETATLPELRDAKEPRTLTNKAPFKVTRQPMAERSGLPAPLGFLLEARFEGRSWHHLATTSIPRDTRELQILVSTDTQEPSTSLHDIRLRPGKMKQPHHVYVKNLTHRPKKFHVEISAGDTLLHRSAKPLTVEPDGVRKVPFDDVAGKELRGTLQVRVLDQDREQVLESRTLRIEIMSPREYVTVAEVGYAPGTEGNNKWHAQVQTATRVIGPAIAAELVLPMRRIPGLVGVGGGTLQVDLPTNTRKLHLLFAEKIQLQRDDQEGPVYLNIDGVPRAFVYRTTFARNGAATLPAKDDRPAVRLVAPTSVTAGINFLVDVEVDNAPGGAKLEVALGRSTNGQGFTPELTRDFSDAKEQRVGLALSKDALVFEASVKDWTATFDTRAILGSRELRARLIDSAGQMIAETTQPVVIDSTPPIARFVAEPLKAKRGSEVQVQAEATDDESGVGQVVFFLGRPERGEVPAGAVRWKATLANQRWTATVSVPADHKGPLPISMHVVNSAGLASVGTTMIDVQEPDAGKSGLGEIRGKVVEGPRPQPNLVVVLSDEQGREIARVRTGPDGTYVFDRLPPGRYRLLCVKPESQRRATMGVTVEPERMTPADLSLAL